MCRLASSSLARAFIERRDAFEGEDSGVFAAAENLVLGFCGARGVQGAGFEDVDGGEGFGVCQDGGAAVGAESGQNFAAGVAVVREGFQAALQDEGGFWDADIDRVSGAGLFLAVGAGGVCEGASEVRDCFTTFAMTGVFG